MTASKADRKNVSSLLAKKKEGMTPAIYKPAIRAETALVGYDNGGYAGSLPDKARDGFLAVSLESDVVTQRISRDLYASPQSGIRELYVNEVRACKEAARHGAKPYIHITIDAAVRSITVEGIDSMGMGWTTFRDVYAVLGRSTNFDGRTPGQFGFGRAAYTCLSDIMIMDIHSRETGERYSVMGRNGVGFQTGLPEPADMDHFGVRISMTVRPDVTFRAIIDMLEACAMVLLMVVMLVPGSVSASAPMPNSRPRIFSEMVLMILARRGFIPAVVHPLVVFGQPSFSLYSHGFIIPRYRVKINKASENL